MGTMWAFLLLLAAAGAAGAASPEGWKAFCSSSLEEVETEVELTKIVGTVPVWLQGAFMKNAAGRYTIGPRSLGNLQDGFSKIYRWRFASSRIFFNTRFLQSPWLQACLANDTITPMMVISPVKPPWTVDEVTEVLLIQNNNPVINLWVRNARPPRVCALLLRVQRAAPPV